MTSFPSEVSVRWLKVDSVRLKKKKTYTDYRTEPTFEIKINTDYRTEISWLSQ
jgi:hypothetical protein